MEFRNAQHNAQGGIDCEINHPKFGWIAFTASPNDSEKHGREIFAAAQSKAAPYVPPPEPTPEEIKEAERAAMEQARLTAYRAEADPLFFQWQAGEATEQEWLDARKAVRERYPYPE